MTSRIVATCPTCNAKLSVGSDKVGKQLRCPKCQSKVQVPESTAEVTSSTDMTQRWKVVVGRKRGGPFGTTQLRQLVDDEKLPADAFVRDEGDAADWFEVQSCEWLTDFPERHSARYCPECDCRVVVSRASSDKLQRCPGCSAPVKFIDFLNVTANPQLDGVSVEPWGKFDVLVIVAAMVALAAGLFGALSLIWNPPFAVLIGFIFLVVGSGLFSVTFQHRSRASKYLTHLPKVERVLEARTNQLFDALTELRALKRNLAQVHSDLVAETEAEFQQQRDELAEQLEIAKDSANAVNRMAERFLNETLKWWNSKLNSENYQATKDRLTKAIDFCRKQGHKVSGEIERHLVKQVQMEYEIVLRREHERSEQKRIREQMREEQRVEREVKRELERIEAEKRAIEKALKEAMQKVGAEHSAEVELLREKLREAEERGVRTQAQAELTKVGNVYVISNIGSFGENVFKVGLTRRLEPLDRVKELGDASVPFTFDVHMMIFSEDAPRLEYSLHQALHKYRVNRVNFRKEFFRVDLETIRTVVEEHHGVVEYVADAEALQYRESLNISEEDFEYLAKVADAAGVEDEDDDLDGADEP
jgi:DNA-directed RNA polymerase subunit RPC12/RpoP